MSRFRPIVVAVTLAGLFALSGLWSSIPPLPPEPPHEVTRGPAVTEAQIYYQEWLMAVKARQASLAATTVSFDTDTVTFFASVLGIITIVLTLLSKYLIAPMITKQVAVAIKELDKSFCTRQDLIVALLATDNEKALLQLNDIWKAEKR